MRTLNSCLRRRRDNERGQAMTEFVIWVFVLLLMISGILWFGKSYDLKLQCHMASRYMSWAYAQRAETEMAEGVIQARVGAYYPMLENAPEYVSLDRFDVFDAGGLASGGDGGLGVISALSGVLSSVSNDVTGWEVNATYNPGGILDNTLPGGSAVRSKHYVAGGTWHKKQVRGDDAIMMVKTSLTAWSYAVLF